LLKILLSLSSIEKIDSQGMHKVYDIWPKIARESFESDQTQVNFDDIDHIVFAGMGGSGAIGEIIAAILSKTNIHTSIIKGYLLPKTVDSKTLVISTSVSGNTQEVLSTLKLSNNIECEMIAFSSGGKIKDYAIKNKIEFREISQIHSPRASFVSFLFSMLKVLKPIIPLKTEDVYESIKKLEIQRDVISSKNLTDSNTALSMAEWINGIPLIYYPSGLQAAAVRFKNSLQENVKMHAITEEVIETCHNGVVAWEKPSNVQPILLEGQDDYVKTKERWTAIKDYLYENKIDFREIHSVDGSILSKLVNLIYFLDYSSIYKAVISKTDPSPVKSINFIKSKLNE
jgi:glucose/mannose-6-phosphate isomerase